MRTAREVVEAFFDAFNRHDVDALVALFLEAVDGVEPLSERTLRAAVHAGSWAVQRAALGSLTFQHS